MLLADDTKIFQEIDADADLHVSNQQAQQDRVDSIAQWAEEWQMEINPSKSKVMHIGRDNPGLPYCINGTQIDSVTTEKDIGFWITDDLSPSTHVHKARSKALGEIWRIRRNFTFIDKRAFCVLYNQRVRPHLDHGMAACPRVEDAGNSAVKSNCACSGTETPQLRSKEEKTHRGLQDTQRSYQNRPDAILGG